MTISTTIIKNSFSGDGSTTAFTYSFPINSTSEITVIIKASTGVETVKTITTHYTVADAGANGGTVTFTSGNIPASGETILLFRNTTKNQVTDLIENDPFLAESLETQFDNLQMQVQEVSEAVDRSFKVAKSNTITNSETTASASARANKILSFDASGNVEATAFTNLDTLTEMTDVTLSSPADNEVLAFDSGTAHFINQTPAEASLVSLTGTETLTNKTLTSPVINTGVSGTAILDEDNLASDSATQLATQQSIKAYVDATVTAEDLDVSDGSSAIAIDLDSEVLGILGGTGLTSAASGNNVTLTVDAAQTGITSLLATDIKIGEDDQTKVDFETADTINFYAGNEKQLVLTDGALTPGTNAIVDLGTDALEFKDGYFDGTLEADAITIAGTALNTVIAGVTVTNATNAVNSTHVSVADNENTNEENLITFIEDTSATGNVGLESDGDFAYNPSTGTVSATIFKGNIDAVDGDFDGTLEADAITVGGTNLTAIYSPIAGSSNVVTTGALNSGSITSGFGTIDTGSSTITTTGVISGGGFTAGNAVLAEAELELLDGLTAGTAIASKVVTTDASKDTTGQRNLTITGELDAATLDISGAIDVAGTANLDVVDIDGAVDMATTLTLAGNADFNGDLDVDGTTNLDVVDIDGAVNMATTALVTGVLTTTAATVFNGGFASNAASSIGGTTPTLTIGDGGAEDAKILFDGNAQDFYIGLDDSTDDLVIGLGNTLGTTPAITIDENTNVFIPDSSLTIIGSGNYDLLTLTSTDEDENIGPVLKLYRNSASPADGDQAGYIKFDARNSASQDITVANIFSFVEDVTDGEEDGAMLASVMLAGTARSRIWMGSVTPETVFNDDSQDIDFRVESNDNANAIFVNGGTNSVTIGAAGTVQTLAGIPFYSSDNSIYTHDVSGTDDTAGFNTAYGLTALDAITTADNNVAVGYGAGGALTSGGENTIMGSFAAGTGVLTGAQNVVIGRLAGQDLTSASKSTIVGWSAGKEVTTATENTYIGYLAAGTGIGTSAYNVAVGNLTAQAATTMSESIMIGHSAGNDNTTGSNIIAIGYQAYDNADTENNNLAIGSNALGGAINGGEFNVAIGNASLDALTSGDNNVAIGYHAGGSMTDGGNATLIGFEAGKALQGNDLTAVGYKAGTATTAGNNTFIGVNAGLINAGGDSNIGIGKDAYDNADAENHNLAIGRNALGGAINGGEFNVAIGNDTLDALTSGDNNTAMGYNAGTGLTTGSSNVIIGKDAGIGVMTGNDNTVIGDQAGKVIAGGASNTCIGNKAGIEITSGSNNTCIGHDAGRSGSPGGAVTTASNILNLGDESVATINAQVSVTAASDERDKTDFTSLDIGLDFVNNLNPVTYRWDKRINYVLDTERNHTNLDNITNDGTHKEDWLDIGFKAQEVETLEKAAGYKIADKTNLVTTLSSDGKMYGMKYEKFVPILVKAVQELSATVTTLQQEISTLKGE
tara:strand:+ start:13021 stop:17436 length:4416 start_codon:yes stop_codon:yes gene_type:complete